jgi:hypothetical protein
MGTLFPAASFSIRHNVRLSPWLADALAGMGLVVFLVAAYFLTAVL